MEEGFGGVGVELGRTEERLFGEELGGRERNQSLIRRKVLSAVICPFLGDQDSGCARQPESQMTLWGLVGLVEWCNRFFAESPEQAPE